jgi:hypothetical protein
MAVGLIAADEASPLLEVVLGLACALIGLIWAVVISDRNPAHEQVWAVLPKRPRWFPRLLMGTAAVMVWLGVGIALLGVVGLIVQAVRAVF